MNKELDSLLWWIPFKNVRHKIRNIYNNLQNKIDYLEYNNKILLEDKIFKDRISIYNLFTSNNVNYQQKRWHLEDMISKGLGYFINLDNPRSLNEKINWIKLHYRNPLMKICADKYLFKGYIEKELGKGYTIPLLNKYDNVNDIDFNKLPKQFVLKSNAGSLSKEIIIVKDKNELNITDIKIKLNNWLQTWNVSGYGSNWFFVDIKQLIIAEEYIEDIVNSIEYSFYCSYGKVIFITLYCNKTYYIDNRISYYDINWNKLNIRREGYGEIENFKIPKNSNKMFQISEKLSKNFPLVRIDFYNIKDTLLVGEMTFTPAGGGGQNWSQKNGISNLAI